MDLLEYMQVTSSVNDLFCSTGSSLGIKNWIRMSFAVSPSMLEEAWDRIESFCKQHAKITQIIQMN